MYVSRMFQRWTQLDSNLEKHAEPWFSTGCTANHRATWGGSGPPQTEWVLLDVAMMMSSGQLAVSMVMHSAFLTRSWTFARLRICGCHGTKQARYLPCVFSFSNFRSLYKFSFSFKMPPSVTHDSRLCLGSRMSAVDLLRSRLSRGARNLGKTQFSKVVYKTNPPQEDI